MELDGEAVLAEVRWKVPVFLRKKIWIDDLAKM